MVKFSLFLSQHGMSYDSIRKVALEAEKLDYSSLWLRDHMFIDAREFPEVWTILSALASETSRIRLGTLTLCYTYRNPVLLAKMVASLDCACEGRFDFGIGACGWNQEIEHPAYGMSFPHPTDRMKQLEEVVRVLKSLWMDESVDFEGRFFQLTSATCRPKPIQKTIPVWVGGSGEKLLKVVANVADGWNTGFSTLEEYQKMRFLLRKECARIGRDLNSISTSYWLHAIFSSSRSELLEKLATAGTYQFHGSDLEQYLTKIAVAGTPEEIRSRLSLLISQGIQEFVVGFLGPAELEPIKLFSREVIQYFA